MKLGEYLKKHKIRIKVFAAKVGVSRDAIQSICYARLKPSLRLAVKILDECNGEVSMEDLLPKPNEQKQVSRRNYFKNNTQTTKKK